MPSQEKPWYLRPLSRETVLRAVPLSRFWQLLAAGFLLFSITGFYGDLMSNGTDPYALVWLNAVYGGLIACLWILAATRLPAVSLLVVAILQYPANRLLDWLEPWLTARFRLHPVPTAIGIRFSATCIVWVCIISYVFFVRYIVGEQKRSVRAQNELAFAHNIQKTLVPPIHLHVPRFEIFGISQPSEAVGGDLVDAVLLSNGDLIAYLADIAGHGLAASILMGRLKTAARTTLLDVADSAPATTLPLMLDRLNTVLPQVKEAHLYATFSGLRLNANGTIFCAMAASPPLLHFHAVTQTTSQTQEPQLPVGLLPVSAFDGFTLSAGPGDLLLVATDGILEIANSQEEEFGAERLARVLVDQAQLPLPQLADKILEAARAFGAQFDDQTLLLIRCL